MEDNKKDFSDFFNQPEDRKHEAEQKQDQERPSYYYSYGPYKSSSEASETASETEMRAVGDAESTPVEMTPPRPIRPFGFGGSGGGQPQQPVSTWTVNEPKRRSNVKTAFSAFMAGALVVSSLMFVSDKMNLFTGDHPLSSATGSTPSGSSSAAGGSTGSNGTKTAAYSDIARPNGIPQIVQDASPAVVLVESYVKQQSRSSRGGSMLDDPFFRYFFGDGSGNGGQQQQPNSKNNNNNNSGSLQEAGIGSGFIFEQSGYILTNEHVIDGADEVRVKMEGSDKEYTAKVVGSSYDYDLAVLKIEGDKAFPTIPIGDSNETAVGDWVVAIGNPLGFDHTVTAGVLSAKERPIDIPDENGTRSYKHLLQTDASINPGNSGGPLLNMAGQVIGINTAVSSQAQGIGFAIPTSTINELLPNLKAGTKIPKPAAPYIGVQLQDITANSQKVLGLDSTNGTVVYSVIPGAPAFKAGLKQYDVIVAANDQPVTNTEALRTKIQALKVGDSIKLSIIRDGKKQDITVTIGDQNNDPSAQQQ